MTVRLVAKVAGAMLAMSLALLLSTTFLVGRAARRHDLDQQQQALQTQAALVARAQPSAAKLPAFAALTHSRVELLGADGQVLGDSGSRPSSEAILSATQSAGKVTVRLSQPARPSGFWWAALLQGLTLVLAPALMLAALAAWRTARQLSRIVEFAGELANGNFQARGIPPVRGELGALSARLDETAAKLERSVQQLQTEHTELEKLERIRKDFVINVSHELRTPLASIQGYTETLMDGALDDQQNNMRFLGIIRHNAERLARLTGDLLALSRIELKTQEFRFAPHLVNDLVAEVLDTILPLAGKKRITLKLERAPEGTPVYCDSEAVYQILSNLLDNAVKYTPADGLITVGVQPQPSGSMLEIYVRDSGIGIPIEDQPRLFERFYRVDKARSRELGGTGLGLAIVKHLVRAHGGEVRVESRPQTGATFFFTLPMYAPA